MAEEIKPGLEGVYIGKSSICKVDGTLGKLYYRGYSIETLAEKSSYEETCYLILYGKLPNRQQLDEFSNKLKDNRNLSKDTLKIIKRFGKNAQVLDVLRTAMSSLSAEDPEPYSSDENKNLEKTIRIIAKTATISAAISRVKEGKRIIKPDKSLGHAENFLYMVKGKRPDKDDARLMDIMFILHAEHSSNASTFASLVACSTLADIYAAVTAGVSALKAWAATSLPVRG